MSDKKRQYKLASRVPRQLAQEILQITTEMVNGKEEETDRLPVMAIPVNTPSELKIDIVQILNRVYQTGRDDKSPGPVGE